MLRIGTVGVIGALKSLSTVILGLLLVFTGQSFAEVYKWVDEHGRIHYGDKSMSDEAEKVTIKKASTIDPPALEREEKRRKLLDIYQEGRTQNKRDRQARIERRKQRQANCDRAREKLEKMRRASYLYKDGNGPDTRKILTDSERGQAESELEQTVKKWCD